MSLNAPATTAPAPQQISDFTLARIAHVTQSLTALTPEQERIAAPARVEASTEPDVDEVGEPDGNTHIRLHYGPGRSVRIVAHEYADGPLRTGVTLPADHVRTDTLQRAYTQVLTDARAILVARRS